MLGLTVVVVAFLLLLSSLYICNSKDVVESKFSNKQGQQPSRKVTPEFLLFSSFETEVVVLRDKLGSATSFSEVSFKLLVSLNLSLTVGSYFEVLVSIAPSKSFPDVSDDSFFSTNFITKDALDFDGSSTTFSVVVCGGTLKSL